MNNIKKKEDLKKGLILYISQLLISIVFLFIMLPYMYNYEYFLLGSIFLASYILFFALLFLGMKIYERKSNKEI